MTTINLGDMYKFDYGSEKNPEKYYGIVYAIEDNHYSIYFKVDNTYIVVPKSTMMTGIQNGKYVFIKHIDDVDQYLELMKDERPEEHEAAHALLELAQSGGRRRSRRITRKKKRNTKRKTKRKTKRNTKRKTKRNVRRKKRQTKSR